MDDPDRWQEGFLETGRIESLAQHPLRETLQKVWDAVSRRLGSGRKRQEREAKRKANRQAAERALVKLWPKLGPVARERLASHHALMIVCSDPDEVQLWRDYLKVTFPKQIQGSEIAAFVRWITSPSGPRVAVVIWNGIVSSMPEMYLYAHELAHVIDGDPEGEQLSSLNEWRAAWNVDKQEIANTIINVRRRERILTDPSEGFATMFALASIDHRYLRTTKGAILGFLKKRRLL